jgi:diguanylate cyclase (GGDEF)-like protein/PAS domain S-box-containing protein
MTSKAEHISPESDALWRTALDHSPTLIAYLDPQFNFLWVNHAYATADQRDPSFFPGKNHFDLYPSAENEAIFRGVVSSGEAVSFAAKPFEYAEHPERGPTHWDWSLAPVKDAAGGVIALVLSLSDVTARISALETTAESEAHYRDLVESANAIPWEMDPATWCFLYVGPQAAQTLGYPQQEWYQPGFLRDHLHPDDCEWVFRYCTNVTQTCDGTRNHELEYRMIAADGRVIWVRDIIKVVCGEHGPSRMQGFMFDITERKQTEMALKEHEELLHSVVNNAPLIIWAVDCNGVFTLSDGKGLADLGLEPGGVVGRSVFDIYAGQHEVTEAMNRALAGERFVQDLTIGDRTYESHYTPLRDSQGTVASVLGVSVDVTERRHVEQALEESERKYRELVSEAASIILRWDTDGNVTFFNEFAQEFFGFREDEILGRNVVGTIVPETEFTGRDLALLMQAICKDPSQFEYNENENIKRNGERVWIAWKNKPIFDHNGKLVELLSVGIDITSRKRAEIQLRQHASALQQTADSVTITNRDGVIEYVNPAFENTTGYRSDEVIGRRPNIMKSGVHKPAFYQNLWRTILKGNVFSDIIVNRRKDGSLYYEEKTITPLKDENGNITHFISTGKDITERMQTQERLQYLAHHDVLTSLPNRALFTDRLEHALALSRGNERPLALLFLDLDRFKIINDTLGHAAGDRALQVVAERLRQCVRKGDTVARLGGDEFAIILEDADAAEHVAPIARKVLETMTQPLLLNGQEYVLTTSIGICIFPGDGENGEILLKNADIAMYRAKEKGRNSYQFYSSDMGVKAFERLNLETSLRRALAQEEFLLYYQPQVNAITGRIIGAEALLRWQHPELGLIGPTEFVPILEDTGLIVPVGEWVVHTACRQAAAWQSSTGEPIRISVNLSPRQFDSTDLADMISRGVESSGLAPKLLEIEVTENVLMRHNLNIIDTFLALDALGVRLSLDDFGTGYSSLSYLKRFPFDNIKIDRSFVRDLPQDLDDAAIVHAIIGMAASLGLQVIAEGVETEAQLAFLTEHDCQFYQGFLFSQPVPADEFQALLAHKPAAVIPP